MKHIMITGASSGIGKALTSYCLQKGHQVSVLVRNKAKLMTSLEGVDTNNLNILVMDLNQVKIKTDFNDAFSLFENNKIDVLINNAGVLHFNSFFQFNKSQIEEMVQVNFIAPLILIQAIISKVNHQGHIINISSIASWQGSDKYPGMSVYGASKAALQSLSEHIAVELIDSHKVYCTALALGAVETPMLRKAFPDLVNVTSPETMAEKIYNHALYNGQKDNGQVVTMS